jgi:alkanesulfonate monooxygenase SsuD/methylene tetrahydromethanopterin reductase-like flavin-dependent oxidoreductase (luciferase family)
MVGDGLKFGILNLGMWHETQDQAEPFQIIQEQAVLADQLGYDSYWVGEHHFSRHGIIADGMLQLAAIAAVTKRIRIGTAVVVLPFHNPVRLAEQIAMVDILSNGRLDVGVGIGYQWREFKGLSANIDDAREQFRDNLQVMFKCWGDGILEHDSKFNQHDVADGIEVMPKPIQRPHPPIYQAVTITPASVEFAASNGIPIMVGGPTDILGLAPQVIELWREKMVEYGNDPTGIEIPCSKGVYVAETDEQAAADIAAVDQHWDLKLLQQVGSPLSPAGDIPPGYEEWAKRHKEREHNALDPTRAGTPPLIGSPATVRDRLRQLQDFGVNSMFGQFGMPGMPKEKIRRCVELFAEVMDDFRTEDQPVTTAVGSE